MGRDEQLRSHESEALDKEGFVVVPDVLAKEEVERVAARLRELLEQHIEELRAVPPTELRIQEIQEQVVDFMFQQRKTIWPRESGVAHLTLEPDDPAFRLLVDHPLLDSSAKKVLGPEAKPDGMRSRIPLPGAGHQGLHQDFDNLKGLGRWERFEGLWVLSPFTAETGTIRVVPRSHLSRGPAHDENDFGWAMPPHTDEVRVIAEPGAVILMNRHLWYSWTFNGSTEPCLSVTIGFKRTSTRNRSGRATT